MTKHTVRRGLSALAAACLAVGAAGVATTPAAYAAPNDAPMAPVELTRVVDTREGLGVATALGNNDVAEVQITGQVPTAGGTKTVVPADAEAVVLNMTAVNAAATGYFVAWESGTSRPATSNINFAAGDTVANGATVPLNSAGKISVFARGGADLLLDVAGYYVDGEYTKMAPSRLYDTRLTPKETAAARSITRINVGDENDIVTLNVTAADPMGSGFVTVWPTQEEIDKDPSIGGMPQTSNLNYVSGQTIANTVTVRAGKGGYVSFYTMAETALVVDKVHDVTRTDPTTPDSGFATMLEPAQRVMDTRVNIGSDKKTGYRNFDLLSLADKTNWDEVGAAIVNVTVTGADADGFAAIGPDLEANGVSTSVLNFKAGQAISNRVIIPASYAGNLQAYTNVEADIILDVMGYTHASDVTMAPVELDLTKAAEESKTVIEDVALSNLSSDSAIALPTGDDALYDLDGGGGAVATTIDGTTATIVDSSGKKHTVTMVKENDLATTGWIAGSSEYMFVPLAGLAPGEYKLSVPLKTAHTTASDVIRANYEASFNVRSFSPTGADWATVTARQVTTAAATTTDAFSFSVDDVKLTATASAATVQDTADAIVAAINASPELTTAGVIAFADDNGPATGGTAQPTVRVVKPGGKAPSLTLGTPNNSVVLGAATTFVAAAADAAGYPVVDGIAGNTLKTTYVPPASAPMVTPPQQVKVKLPTGFDLTTDKLEYMVGSVLIKEDTNAWTTSGEALLTVPTREEFVAKKVAVPSEVTVKITSTDSTTNEVLVPVKIK